MFMGKIIVPSLIALLVGGGIGFYGGMQYAKNTRSVSEGWESRANDPNLSPEERAQFMARRGSGQGGKRGAQSGPGTLGEIIAKDETSVTVKLRDGGSKIIFFGSSTQIVKSMNGSLADLSIGTNVFANGMANDDGSIAAESIQIRAEMPQRPRDKKE